jgi:hypothetical protein
MDLTQAAGFIKLQALNNKLKIAVIVLGSGVNL